MNTETIIMLKNKKQGIKAFVTNEETPVDQTATITIQETIQKIGAEMLMYQKGVNFNEEFAIRTLDRASKAPSLMDSEELEIKARELEEEFKRENARTKRQKKAVELLKNIEKKRTNDANTEKKETK